MACASPGPRSHPPRHARRPRDRHVFLCQPLLLNNQAAESHSITEAEAALQTTFQNDCDPVPCLQCGHYQREMVAKIHAERYPWLPLVFVLLLVATIFLAVLTLMVYQKGASEKLLVTMLLVTGALALTATPFGIAQFKVSRLDPNAAPVEVRRAQGRERSVTLEEYHQLLMREQKEQKGHKKGLSRDSW